MKNDRFFGERDFLEYFANVAYRFDIEAGGVFLAAEENLENLSKAERRAIREYPHTSRDTPALEFPFSYLEAEQFAVCFELWSDADMEGLLLATGELFTLDQVAKELKTDIYGVWRLMQPQNDPHTHEGLPVLQPSVFFDNVYLHWRGEDGGEMGGDNHGLFELFNSRGLAADSRGVVKVPFLVRDGVFYAVPKSVKLKVNVSRVYVTCDDLNSYRQAIGERPIEVERTGGKTERIVRPLTSKKKTPDNTGRKDPFSLKTTISACLQAFWKDRKRKPGGKSAIGEFVDFVVEQHAARTDKSEEVFRVNIIEIKRSKSSRFIRLKAKISAKDPSGKHWHGWHAFENQFSEAMNKFTPESHPAGKNSP